MVDAGVQGPAWTRLGLDDGGWALPLGGRATGEPIGRDAPARHHHHHAGTIRWIAAERYHCRPPLGEPLADAAPALSRHPDDRSEAEVPILLGAIAVGEEVALTPPGMPEPLDGADGLDLIDLVSEEILSPRVGAVLAVQRLEEQRRQAELGADGAIVLLEPVTFDPILFQALGLAREDGPVTVRGRVDGRTTVVAVWSAPLLAVERRRSDRRWGLLFDLPRTLSPLSFGGIDARRPPVVEEWSGEDPPELAAELLGEDSTAERECV